jgi:hypothetical protein
MLSEIAYANVFGLSLLLWIGMAAFLFLLAASALMLLTLNMKYKSNVTWHMRLAAIGLALAVLHVILALSGYLGF